MKKIIDYDWLISYDLRLLHILDKEMLAVAKYNAIANNHVANEHIKISQQAYSVTLYNAIAQFFHHDKKAAQWRYNDNLR